MINNFVFLLVAGGRQVEEVMELSYENTLHLHNVIPIANLMIDSEMQILCVSL